MGKAKANVLQRAKKIKLLLMDVDGVLTDGSISLLSEPGGKAREIKTFNSLDGAGLRLAELTGIRTGVITGRESAAVTARAKELQMDYVVQDAFRKLPAFEQILSRARLKPAQVCFVGDDITDLPVMARVGLAVAVANAHPEAKRAAHLITRAAGGHGAVREVVDLLLHAQGHYQKLLRQFLV
jgi:3-deoxy-D-manno-octulosonate 8-phosphate phosphatase (KDO 8-P phosphatase)